ncbi:MAG TPA: hypothetical protein VFV55_06880 [Usitatibacteraceae bacterium]|nr:hypothetical protein [Usitatibacteraceae bacterium]
MDYKTSFPEYQEIEKIIAQARLERSAYLGGKIASAIVAVRDAVRGFMDRSPLRGSRIPWGPDDQLPNRTIAWD